MNPNFSPLSNRPFAKQPATSPVARPMKINQTQTQTLGWAPWLSSEWEWLFSLECRTCMFSREWQKKQIPPWAPPVSLQREFKWKKAGSSVCLSRREKPPCSLPSPGSAYDTRQLSTALPRAPSAWEGCEVNEAKLAVSHHPRGKASSERSKCFTEPPPATGGKTRRSSQPLPMRERLFLLFSVWDKQPRCLCMCF